MESVVEKFRARRVLSGRRERQWGEGSEVSERVGRRNGRGVEFTVRRTL